MAWADLFGKFRRAKSADGDRVVANDRKVPSTPIRSFTVLGLAYPNHIHPRAKPVTAYDIALRLSHDMDVDWFGHDAELRHFATTEPMRGHDDTEDAFGFDFGPFDRDVDEFSHRYTVIVRETAGGGYMALIENSAAAFADKTSTLFKAIAADPDRQNPERPDADDEQAS